MLIPIYRKKDNIYLIFIFYLFLLTVLFIISILAGGMKIRSLLLISLICILILPLAVRHISGKLDLFEPIVTANIAMLVMFVGRPLSDLLTGETIHRGYDVLITFDLTLLVVILSACFFQIGYFSRLGRRLSRFFPCPPKTFSAHKATIASIMYVLLGTGLFAVFLYKAGVLYKTGGLDVFLFLMKGRHQSNNAIFLGSTAYFYFGILTLIPACLVFFSSYLMTKNKAYLIFSVLLSIIILNFFGARGSRANLLPLISSIPIFWYLHNKRRPSLIFIIFSVMVFISFQGYIRETRNALSDKKSVINVLKAFCSPHKEALEILKSPDTEMFDSLANELLVVPSELPYKYGATITDIMIRCVPRMLWNNKPLEANDAVVNKLWPKHYTLSRASPAFSIIGPFYADSGIIMAAIGMFCIGIILSSTWHWYRSNYYFTVAQIIYSMCIPFFIILMRGSIPDTLARALFILIPLLLLLFIFKIKLLYQEKRF